MNYRIYIRTSTEDKTPEIQLRDIEKSFQVTDNIYSDKQSAWSDAKERPYFNILLKEIKSKLITDIYIWDWDRIFRNRLRLKEFFVMCKHYNVKIHSHRQLWYEGLNAIHPPFNEIMQELMINILGWMAEEESTKKSERVHNAIKKSKGVTISYKGNKWGRKSVSTQAKNKVLELWENGLTTREIAEQVQITDKNNNLKNISKSAVHKIIQDFKGKNNSFGHSPQREQ